MSFLEYKCKIYGELGWAYVVVIVIAYLTATATALENVVVEIGISKAHLKLKVYAL